MRHSTSQGRYSPSTISCGRCAHFSPLFWFCYSRFDLAVSTKRGRTAGDDAIRSPILHHTPHNGNAHSRHARRRDQGRPRVERHDALPAFHDRFLESHLRLAQGLYVPTLVLIHVTYNRR